MKLQFTTENISEYKNGPYHFVNDGKPFEVEPSLAADFLAAQHQLDGEPCPIFEVVPADSEVVDSVPEDTSDSESESESEEETETAELLAKKHSRAELEQMAKDAGLDGDSYTNKTELADAILAAKGA